VLEPLFEYYEIFIACTHSGCLSVSAWLAPACILFFVNLN